MAYYNVSFSIKGVKHYTTGESSYPTQENYEKGEYSVDICMTNAMMFIAGYKDVKKIEDQVYRQNVSFTISFD